MSGADEQPAGPARAPRVSEIFEDVGLPGIVLHELAVAQATARSPQPAVPQALPQAPLKASRFTIDAGCGTTEDHHAVHELWFIGRGRLDVYYDGTWHAVTRGDVLYFSPWKKHYSKNTGDEQAMVFSVWWP